MTTNRLPRARVRARSSIHLTMATAAPDPDRAPSGQSSTARPMDTREISLRLHDILRAAYRVRLPGPGCTAGAAVDGIDDVKAQVRALLADLGSSEPPRLPPRIRATAAAFPEGRIAGTRATVQHRRRTRYGSPPAVDPIRRPGPVANLARPETEIRPFGCRAVAEAFFTAPTA